MSARFNLISGPVAKSALWADTSQDILVAATSSAERSPAPANGFRSRLQRRPICRLLISADWSGRQAASSEASALVRSTRLAHHESHLAAYSGEATQMVSAPTYPLFAPGNSRKHFGPGRSRSEMQAMQANSCNDGGNSTCENLPGRVGFND